MTDLPNSEAELASSTSTPAGDPELAALVRGSAPPTPPLPTARPRRRRALFVRFGVAFLLGILLAVAIGAGAMYAWSAQYEGRVLPGVSVGSTDLGGMTREQAEAAITGAYGSFSD